VNYKSVKYRASILKPTNLEEHVEVSGIHFNAQIQAFSIGANSSSEYHQTISIGENRDLNGNHMTQQVTNVFHANRHDFAFPPRMSLRGTSRSHLSANAGDIPRTRLHLPQCGAGYVRPIQQCTFEASSLARGCSHRSTSVVVFSYSKLPR